MNIAVAIPSYVRAFPLFLSLLLLLGTGSTVRAQDTEPVGSEAEADTQRDALPTITVYKRPNCSCCVRWVEHLRRNGFDVNASIPSNLEAVKEDLGVPDSLRSCHTAQVDGYVIEGHVPAEPIKRMLKEQPDIAGLSVPGMPVGSPGMEMEGRKPEPYKVIAFAEDGSTSVYARR